ncbi:hypothetical protein EG328_000559 [Venturia inaequalis]|uniref:Uncharacterized protein n=1 Tax=Venturia inaequalis TaxID=5025 RepID=A0A8H3VBP5_VENIN|nr:hypothetical protein EG327_004908 [Venturia inaequalis]KAE9988089.1 hypothetical protein EG328_000559 [Venturia inaequalis]RDI77628.1 hypothetical protein Vi05172_g12339 [Venturia inaequalis]
MSGSGSTARHRFTTLKETKSYAHQLCSRVQTRDEITSLWLTIVNHVFPLSEEYRIDLRTRGGGETTAVLDVSTWVRGNATVAGYFRPILQVVMIEQAIGEQPGGSRVPSTNNFERVFFGDGGPDRWDVPMLCTTGVDMLVEDDDDVAETRKKSTKKGGVESSLKGGGKVDKWVSLRVNEGENWAGRLFDSVKR